MLEGTRKGWVTACFLGFGLLFVAFSFGELVQSFLRPSHWPEPAALPSFDPATDFGGLDPRLAAELYRANLAYHFIPIAAFGGVIGWLQSRALDTPEIESLRWVLLTALGFVSIFVFEALRPGVVTGGHPAPLEPLLIGVVGGGFAGSYQYVYMRTKGIVATKWLALWILGLCAGAAVAAVVLSLLGFLGPFMRSVIPEDRLYAVSQFVFYLIYGPTVGAAAGLVSGGAIVEALPDRSRRGGSLQ